MFCVKKKGNISKPCAAPLDIIVVGGQSNAQGTGREDEKLFVPSDNILLMYSPYSWKKNNYIKCKKSQLQVADRWKNGCSSFSLFFAEHYAQSHLQEGRKILILQTAVGGSGFCLNQWGSGKCLQLNADALIGEALGWNKDNKVVAILWHQGETDAMGKVSEDEYYCNIKQTIADFRSSAKDERVPFLLGDMVECWKPTVPESANIVNANIKAVQTTPNCTFVASHGLESNKEPDIIHFSTKANKEFGYRYFIEYCKLR